MIRSNFDQEMRRPSVVTFGVFDGLHRGHQAIVERVVQLARQRGGCASVVTFDPHPALVLAPTKAPRLIGTLDQRLEGLERLGIEQVAILDFDESAAREDAASFVQRVLVEYLHTCDLVVGDDVHFGRGREGDLALLVREGERHGFQVHRSLTLGDGRRFSSSSVRSALELGDVAGARTILGRPFVLRGDVVHGDARGREIGFATANIDLAPRQQVPNRGIYAGAVRWAGSPWQCAAISVGTRPQFYDDGQLLVEVHIPDFNADLYDEVLDVAFLESLRGEARFASVDDLVAQMGRDVAKCREIFSEFTPQAWALLG